MERKRVSTVIEFIEAIRDLTSSESKIAYDQIRNLQSLKVQNSIHAEPTGLSVYFDQIIKAKENALSSIQDDDRVCRYSNRVDDLPASTSVIPSYKFYYRGQYNTAYNLLPSAFRRENWHKEDYYYHEIMVQCPEHFIQSSHLDKLVTMQHYDCPTRLLDVTSNPLVALYFACKNYGCAKCGKSSEGEVFIFPVLSNDVVYSDSDRALLLSCLSRFSDKDKQELYNQATASLPNGKFKQISGGSRYQDNVVERFFHEITTEMPSFKREIKPLDILQPLFVQPNKTNARIIKQDGAFIINGLSKTAREAELKLEAIRHASIIITNQKGILVELEALGIHEASLFPEVDKVAQYLKSR